MSRSVLLQLSRDSIQEVLQAQNSIDKQALLDEHPLLHQSIKTRLNLYLNSELRVAHSNTNQFLINPYSNLTIEKSIKASARF